MGASPGYFGTFNHGGAIGHVSDFDVNLIRAVLDVTEFNSAGEENYIYGTFHAEGSVTVIYDGHNKPAEMITGATVVPPSSVTLANTNAGFGITGKAAIRSCRFANPVKGFLTMVYDVIIFGTLT